MPGVVSITFDDASRNQLRALRLMEQYGFRGTLGVVTGRVGQRYRHTDNWLVLSLSWEEVAQFAQADWEIASHSRDHRSSGYLRGPYKSLSDEELREEICGSKTDLEFRGYSPVTFIRPGNPYQNPLTERDMETASSCFKIIRLYRGNTPADPSLNQFSLDSLQELASTHLRGYPELLQDVEKLLSNMKEREWVVFAVHGLGLELEGSNTITLSDFEETLKLLSQAKTSLLTLEEAMTTLNQQGSN